MFNIKRILRIASLSLGIVLSVPAVPVKSQQITSDGFVITTNSSVIECHVVAIQQGSQTQVTILKDGVQVGQTVFTSPTTTQVETWVQQTMGTALKINVDSGNNGTITVDSMQFFIHVVTFNPFVVKILSANIGVSVNPNWWQ